MANVLGLPASERSTIYRAALLHDIGLVAIPSSVLHKPEHRLTDSEWARLRLHPYHAERILSRVSAFLPAVLLVAAHRERPDGQGYFRGLRAD
jgi:HD-GYP domain-containing protein (c-di-GMP phosphodiesterase class II)